MHLARATIASLVLVAGVGCGNDDEQLRVPVLAGDRYGDCLKRAQQTLPGESIPRHGHLTFERALAGLAHKRQPLLVIRGSVDLGPAASLGPGVSIPSASRRFQLTTPSVQIATFAAPSVAIARSLACGGYKSRQTRALTWWTRSRPQPTFVAQGRSFIITGASRKRVQSLARGFVNEGPRMPTVPSIDRILGNKGYPVVTTIPLPGPCVSRMTAWVTDATRARVQLRVKSREEAKSVRVTFPSGVKQESSSVGDRSLTISVSATPAASAIARFAEPSNAPKISC